MTTSAMTSAMKSAMTSRSARTSWLLLLVLLAGAALVGSASACSVCTAGRDEENQLAFLLSTLFMSLLPLLVIGSFVFVLWRRMRRLEIDEAASATPATATAAGASSATQASDGADLRAPVHGSLS